MSDVHVCIIIQVITVIGMVITRKSDRNIMFWAAVVLYGTALKAQGILEERARCEVKKQAVPTKSIRI